MKERRFDCEEMIDAILFLFVSQSVCRNSVLNEFDFGIII